MRRERLVPLIVATALFMETMDATVIATSLPAIAVDLGTDPLSLRLAVTSYLISLAVVIPASGWIADRFGARTIFRLAIGIFMLGSICCAFAPSLAIFVASRILQGIGGALMVPVGRMVLVRTVDRRELVNAMAWLTIPALIGPVTGPPLGGFITTYFSWHWIFFINIPIGLLGITLVSIYIENFKEEKREPFDLVGFILAGLGLVGLAFGFSVLGLSFISYEVIAGLLIGGAIFMTAYVFYARRHPSPILDLSLLKLPTFRANVVGGFLFRGGVGALPFILPLMLQIGFHLTPFQSGLVTFSVALGAMQMKAIVPFVLRNFGFRNTLIWNGVITGLTLAACAAFTPATPYVVMVAVLLVHGLFRSLQFTAVNSIGYADVDPARITRATPLLAVAQQLSQSAGVALGATSVHFIVHANGHTTPVASDFPPAFIIAALFSIASVLVFMRLSPDAGEELANRTPSSSDATDQRAN